jgi:L-ribulose-5-phosphate 4-epimerase
MKYRRLREAVFAANQAIHDAGLVVLTWGNASGIDRSDGVVAIKPSGVPYHALTAADIVLVALATGETVEGALKPSSDTPTHLELYRAFGNLGGIVHTHSCYATSWAQAGLPIPCMGTTHADHFHGPIPITRSLTPEEIDAGYERHTARVVVECFAKIGKEPLHVPGVLLPHHGPFAWGDSPAAAVRNAVALEEVAHLATLTRLVKRDAEPPPETIVEKHFLRKHGPNAYYGQRR